jgi:transposase
MIRQIPLYSFETLMQYDEATRLFQVLSKLDTTPITAQLNKTPGTSGPKGYSFEAMLNALIAQRLCGIPTITRLVERLRTDPRFRYDCGFAPWGQAPSCATFSRFFKMITDRGLIESLFKEVATGALQQGLVSYESVAIDSTAIEAYERAMPLKQINDSPNANWGIKKNSDGKRQSWFGYKLHAAVDAQSGLPIALITTPANVNDATQAIPLMQCIDQPVSNWLMDAAYDCRDIYQAIEKRHSQAFIPLNLRGEKEPPAGFNKDRVPVCSGGYDMVYWGYDAKRKELKYRCPHVCGKVDCLYGSQWCSSSNYGMVRKISVNSDLRNHPPTPRHTQRWQSTYNLRTSAERFNAMIKTHLGANRPMVRGIEKVHTHLLLCSITLLAMAFANACVKAKVA